MDQEQKRKGSPLVLVLIIIIVVLVVAGAVLLLGKFGEKPAEDSLGDTSTPLIGYEEGVTAVDEESLQKAVDEAYAEAAKGGIPVEYRNEATSADGKSFDCYIANPTHAEYDVYIQIFADEALSDQLYLSGLIPAGKALSSIKLDHKLAKGTNRVFVAYTQVENDHATIRNQVMITMDFAVT